MNKARREFAQDLIAQGKTPKEAYEAGKAAKLLLSHAVWKDGALVKNKLKKK